MMLVVALTGGIGTGKSIVCSFLSEFGAKAINADKIANHITATDKSIITKIKQRFGPGIYDSENHLDRQRLGQIVFSDDEARTALNRIVHPALIKMIDHNIRQARQINSHRLLIIEAALIYEMEIENRFDFVVAVSSPIETVIQRISKRDTLTYKTVLSRIHSQISQAEKNKRADYIIENNGDWDTLRSRTKQLYDLLISKDRLRHCSSVSA